MSNTFNVIAAFKREINTVSPDGSMGLGRVGVSLRGSDGHFFIAVPDFICEAINVDPMIVAVSLDDACREYEGICENYSTWRLGKRPTPALAIVFQREPRTGIADEYGLQHVLGMGIVEVCINGTVHVWGDPIYQRHESPELFGERLIGVEAMYPLVVADTPEVRAQYERLAATFKTASEILAALEDENNPDPLATFLSIKFDGNPGAPAAETKTPEPAPAPAQAELPLTTSNDDEEL
jgi:hypothetical protein